MLPDNDFLHDLCHQNDCLYRCLSLCRAGMLTVTPLRTAHAGVLATRSPVWVQGVSMESARWFGHTEIRVKPRNQTLMTTKSMCTLQEMLSWLTEPSGCAVLPQFLEAVVVFPMPVSSQVSHVSYFGSSSTVLLWVGYWHSADGEHPKLNTEWHLDSIVGSSIRKVKTEQPKNESCRWLFQLLCTGLEAMRRVVLKWTTCSSSPEASYREISLLCSYFSTTV